MGSINIHCDDVMRSIEFRAGYGHSVTGISPSVSFSSAVSFSFSPSSSISEEDYSYHVFK